MRVWARVLKLSIVEHLMCPYRAKIELSEIPLYGAVRKLQRNDSVGQMLLILKHVRSFWRQVRRPW